MKTEYSLKIKLTEVSTRFEKQEELKEEQSALSDVLKPLERTINGWKEKIKNHEAKSSNMNKEIETLKEESLKVTTEIKEYEALVGPVRELKEKLDKLGIEADLKYPKAKTTYQSIPQFFRKKLGRE